MKMETIDFNQVIKENISVVGELIGTVDSNKKGLATPSMYNFKPFVAYEGTGCYRLGKKPNCLIFGGRDSTRGAFFVDDTNNILKIVDNSSRIKFYKDEDLNIYVYTISALRIRALMFNTNENITRMTSFDPQNYTEITPV